MKEMAPSAERRQALPCQFQRLFITIKAAEHGSRRRRKHGRGMPAEAQRAVQIARAFPAQSGNKGVERFLQKNGNMPGTKGGAVLPGVFRHRADGGFGSVKLLHAPVQRCCANGLKRPDAVSCGKAQKGAQKRGAYAAPRRRVRPGRPAGLHAVRRWRPSAPTRSLFMPKGKRHVKAHRAVQFLLPHNIIEYFSLYILYKSSCDILKKNVTDSKESPRNAVQLDKIF